MKTHFSHASLTILSISLVFLLTAVLTLPCIANDHYVGARTTTSLQRSSANFDRSALEPLMYDAVQNFPSAAPGDLDTSFDPGLGATIGGTVYAIATQSDGKIILGGSFIAYDGVRCNGLVRVNIDGSLDTSFTPATELNAVVYALAIQSDGKIILGGFFKTYGGVSRSNIARIN